MQQNSENLSAINLSNDEQNILLEIVNDPHGVEANAAISQLAPKVRVKSNVVQEGLNKLLAFRYIYLTAENTPRYKANNSKSNDGTEDGIPLNNDLHQFSIEGHPHSPEAKRTLEEIFNSHTGQIYLALELTDPQVFSVLSSRTERGYKTTFLIPQKNDIDGYRQQHYEEMISKWVTFIKDSPQNYKRIIDIRITDIAFKDIYTSLICADIARFDIYCFNEGTTRKGTVLQVNANCSLYVTIEQRYKQAVSNSLPLWRVWPLRAAFSFTKRFAIPFGLLGIGIPFHLIDDKIGYIISSISIGLFVGAISDWGKLEKWRMINLFQKP